MIEFVAENFFQRAPAPFGSAATVGNSVRSLELLVGAALRRVPELADGFDAEMWALATQAAFREVDRLNL